jgi:hypothetical protein
MALIRMARPKLPESAVPLPDRGHGRTSGAAGAGRAVAAQHILLDRLESIAAARKENEEEYPRLRNRFTIERKAEAGGHAPSFQTVPPALLAALNDRELTQAVANAQKELVLRAAAIAPAPFAVLGSNTFSIGEHTLSFGSPLELGKHNAIPLYVTHQDQTAMIFAYQSKSHACWRRYAGFLAGIFWKGRSQHFQNFDWRIQKELDCIYYSRPSVPLKGPDGDLLKLSDFGLTAAQAADERHQKAAGLLVIGCEDILQGAMEAGAKPFDIHDEGNKPELLLDYWWAGREDEAYGIHLNMMVVSRNRNYLYCIAVSDDGMFPKYVQDFGSTGINAVGAPATGVPFSKEHGWLLTPIVEYSDETRDVEKEAAEQVVIKSTVLGGGNRVRVRNAHTSEKSPFFELNNGMACFYRLLRAGAHEEAGKGLQKILATKGRLPVSATPQQDAAVSGREVEDRHHQLIEAYHDFEKGLLDPAAEEGRSRMARLSVGRRELVVFRRYLASANGWKNGNPEAEVPVFVGQRLMKRLEWMARQWVADTAAEPPA